MGETVLDSLDAIYKQGEADPDSPEAQLFNITQDGLSQFFNSSTPEEASNTTVINDIATLNGDIAEAILDRIETAIIESAENRRNETSDEEDK